MDSFLLETVYFGIVISLLSYWIAVQIRKLLPYPIFNPLLISAVTVSYTHLLAATEKSQVSGGSVVSGDSAVGNAIAQKALTRVGYMLSLIHISALFILCLV